MSEEKKSGYHPSQIAVAALAAVTAAILGSTLGVAGTVLGAAIGAIVTTVAAELYARSIDRVRSRVVKSDAGVPDNKTEKSIRGVRWQLLTAGALVAFVLGMVVITGIEWVRGEPLSGDGKTTIGGVLQRPEHGEQKSTPSQKTPPPSTVTVTETPSSTPSRTPPPTTTTPPPTTGSGSSSPSTPPGSTTDPVQSDTPSAPPKSP
ncbi:hypothetical protein [Kibdelosporangium phytohabitans]|uniref:hypothetical protein n=1 Tax=Kibdelosporangium phytohabitans TaxID=860235 RepID=UPI000B1C58E5|nr:hypothetical protein [Kibdelosporangium phytohabitans]MBE1465991.1 hypothetical protein [Kibdelosporangium phytohabitans]